MAQPFVGEIMMFAGNFAPFGWAFCDGAIQSISNNQVLFQLIGTTYGGDGQTTFALPDLRSRMPLHQGTAQTGTNYLPGQASGSETVTLTVNHLPSHTHLLAATSNNGNSKLAGGSTIPAAVQGTFTNVYSDQATDSNMAANIIGNAGGGQPHNNLQPRLAITFCIAFNGIFPSQN